MPTDEEINLALDIIAEKEPQLIGLGFMSSLYPIASEVTRRIRQRFPNTSLVWGGIHPTSDPQGCIDEVDYLCVGEEACCVDLCKALAGRRDHQHSKYWANVDGVVHENSPRP